MQSLSSPSSSFCCRFELLLLLWADRLCLDMFPFDPSDFCDSAADDDALDSGEAL